MGQCYMSETRVKGLIWSPTWDGVGDRHERRVQCRSDSPNRVVSHDASKTKGGDNLGEGGIWSRQPQTKQGADTCYRKREEKSRFKLNFNTKQSFNTTKFACLLNMQIFVLYFWHASKSDAPAASTKMDEKAAGGSALLKKNDLMGR